MVLEKAVELFSRALSGSVSCRTDSKPMKDYASLDVYLMRDSMEKHGLWSGNHDTFCMETEIEGR